MSEKDQEPDTIPNKVNWGPLLYPLMTLGPPLSPGAVDTPSLSEPAQYWVEDSLPFGRYGLMEFLEANLALHSSGSLRCSTGIHVRLFDQLVSFVITIYLISTSISVNFKSSGSTVEVGDHPCVVTPLPKKLSAEL